LHDVTLNRGNIEEVLGSIKIPTLSIGISSDILYPPKEQKQIANLIPNSTYAEIHSIHGHDAFLIEFEQIENIVSNFFSKNQI